MTAYFRVSCPMAVVIELLVVWGCNANASGNTPDEQVDGGAAGEAGTTSGGAGGSEASGSRGGGSGGRETSASGVGSATSSRGTSSTGGSGGVGGSGGGSGMCTNVRPTGTEWDEATCDDWASQTDACGEAWMIDSGYCNESCGRCG